MRITCMFSQPVYTFTYEEYIQNTYTDQYYIYTYQEYIQK